MCDPLSFPSQGSCFLVLASFGGGEMRVLVLAAVFWVGSLLQVSEIRSVVKQARGYACPKPAKTVGGKGKREVS